MIRRDRKSEAIPSALVGPRSAGAMELEKFLKWFASSQRKQAAKSIGKSKAKNKSAPKRPSFSAYKAASVVQGLERLFEGKCAYCESPYKRTQPVDVEHWRPKAEVVVTDQDGKTRKREGYGWLAANWDNLLPSCIDCNRERKHHVLEKKHESYVAQVRKVGKANLFPLFDESTRAHSMNDPLEREEPKLLNPCIDDPTQFFVFREGVVVPREELGPRERDRALTSIEVYGLNRKGLVDERRELLVLLEARFRLIAALSKIEESLATGKGAASGSQDDRVADLRETLVELIDVEVQELCRQSAPGRPYASMAQQVTAELLKSLAQASPSAHSEES